MKPYNYSDKNPLKISVDDLTDKEKYLLTESKTFCMYPWVHLHAYPTGEAYPCCHADMDKGIVGNCRTSELSEIWNSDKMTNLRKDMINGVKNSACTRCYEQEESGFFSGRLSANKHHGHHIKKINTTPFELTYWDIRFSNLCNLSCRSCGHIFSSNWHKDQKTLILKSYWDNIKDDDWPENPPETENEYNLLPDFIKNELSTTFNNELLNKIRYVKTIPALTYAGKSESDMSSQLLQHIDHVEQIYFAGGEPLMMKEHYDILDELEQRGKFDVKLVYNTNFTQTKLKDRLVFDYWKKFKSVSVGASLDAMGARGEYIRKGTSWDIVERNRELMLQICPDVDFYISPTLSILNAWVLPDFHKDWVSRGLIKPQDLNVNILQFPMHYRIDIAPMSYKLKLKKKFEEHIEWLKSKDSLTRATVGFESAIRFMMVTDNSHLLNEFWNQTDRLDSIRRENIIDVLPELKELKL